MNVSNCLRYFSLAIVLLICIQPASIDSSRILGYFPSPSKSHSIIHCWIANYLAEAGHEVTVIGPHPETIKDPKYKYIALAKQELDPTLTKELISNPKPFYQRLGSVAATVLRMANDSFTDPAMQKFLREHDEKAFDLVILGYFMNDFHLGLAAHFQCPSILSFMLQPIDVINQFIGNPAELSYTPTVFSSLKQPMNFWQRVIGFLIGNFEHFVVGSIIDKQNEELYSLHFPPTRYTSLKEIRKNVSLVFVNHHQISEGPVRPNVPALIEIGGIQIKERPNPLPEDIAAILDNSDEGLIYFSFGTNIHGNALEPEKAQLFFNTLSKLPYKVLWKWSHADIPGNASNIFYKSWLPQDDVLAHPNVRLFITHGGQGSVVESQYHGVPMIGIPFLGDQHNNVLRFTSSGFGLGLDYITLTEEKLHAAIMEVIENEEYGNAVKKFSKLYRDRPMKPRDLVVFWTEYVLRHNGAKHLQSPAVHMNLFQLLSLDVIAFLLTILIVILVVFINLCKCLCCRNRKTQRNGNDSKKIK